MKRCAIFFIALIVSTLANPAVPIFQTKEYVFDIHQVPTNAYFTIKGTNDQRFVTSQIIQAIEDASQSIKDAGLDPYQLTGTSKYELPVPVIFAASTLVDNLIFTGLSNIVVHQMDFSILANRLTFNISLPRISLVFANSSFDVTLFGQKYEGSSRGSLDIVQPRIAGYVRVSIGIITGISVRSLSLAFTLGGIESNLNVNLLGHNLSGTVNSFLRTTIPATLTEFSAEINELIEAIAWQVIEEIL